METVKTWPLSPHQQSILESRSLDLELLAKLGVRSCAKFLPDSIAIPFVLNGETVNWKFRTIDGEKRFSQVKDAPKIFWNADALTDETLRGQPLIITEGEFDAIAAIQAGFARVVSVPDGAPAQEIGEAPTTKYDYLAGFPDSESVPEVILATDNDAPGVNLMNDLARRIGRTRCKWITYPYRPDRAGRCKDLNEVLLWYGAKGIVQTIANARWIALPGLYRIAEMPPLGDPLVYDIGIEGMESHYRARLGDLAVITGIPGHGKTTFVNEVCFNLARHRGLGVCFASFEQSPQREHLRNLRTLFHGKWVKYQTPDEIAYADEFVNRAFTFMVPGDDDEPTLEWFIERAKAAAIRYDARVIVLDPWNEISHQRPQDMSLTEYVGDAIKTLKRFARSFGVHLIVVAHPAKMRRDRDGKFPMPALYDISDSANFSNKADVGIIVHRTQTGTVIRTAKARYRDIGIVGEVKATFNEQTLRFVVERGETPRLPYDASRDDE